MRALLRAYPGKGRATGVVQDQAGRRITSRQVAALPARRWVASQRRYWAATGRANLPGIGPKREAGQKMRFSVTLSPAGAGR